MHEAKKCRRQLHNLFHLIFENSYTGIFSWQRNLVFSSWESIFFFTANWINVVDKKTNRNLSNCKQSKAQGMKIAPNFTPAGDVVFHLTKSAARKSRPAERADEGNSSEFELPAHAPRVKNDCILHNLTESAGGRLGAEEFLSSHLSP